MTAQPEGPADEDGTVGQETTGPAVATIRSYSPLQVEHLDRLSEIAAADRDAFCQEYPEYVGRHALTVLVQSAAQHYLQPRTGVKELDVLSFFWLPDDADRFPADLRVARADFGPSSLGRQAYDLERARNDAERARWSRWSQFQGRRVDLLVRGWPVPPQVPAGTLQSGAGTSLALRALQDWLRGGVEGSTAFWLAQRPVVVIDPQPLRGQQAWSPHRPRPDRPT